MIEKAAAHAGAVIKGILFIGFSIQIIVGVVWMCCNFMQIQEFPATDAALYSGLFRLMGEQAQVMYLLQLTAAFAVGYFFLQSLMPTGRFFAVWRGLALVTFPFAVQCHLALLPHSFVGTLFLAMLLFMVKAVRGKKGWCFALLCLVGLVLMSGIGDKASREELSRKGLEGMMASRMSWYTLLNDYKAWPEDLQELTAEIYFEATLAPDNMDLLLETIDAAVGEEKAKEYYGLIAQIGWEQQTSNVIHKMVWDVLGYTLSPVVVQMQFADRAYDSYTGRNYECMRDAFPKLTAWYVDYSCWWFVVTLILATVESVFRVVVWFGTRSSGGSKRKKTGVFRNILLPVGLCCVFSAIWSILLTMRGAGMMDYKLSFAVNELWLLWALLLMGKTGD